MLIRHPPEADISEDAPSLRPSSMAAERRVAALSRHLTSASDVDIVSKIDLRDFEADEVYRFLTRDNLELRARMLDHLKVYLSK